MGAGYFLSVLVFHRAWYIAVEKKRRNRFE